MFEPKNRFNIVYTLKFSDGTLDKSGEIVNSTDDSELFLLKSFAIREPNFNKAETCIGSVYPIVAPYKTARLFSYSRAEIASILRKQRTRTHEG